MSIDIDDDNKSIDYYGFNDTNNAFSGLLTANHYNKYTFFAVLSALIGLPSNILLLVILIRIGLFSRRQSGLILAPKKITGSFERFLFEIVFIDTLLIIYDFVDNLLSYIHEDRSAGRHYLIHISDFCCKFFTYIAKMSIPLTTWLLLFLIINQLILTMEYNNNNNNDNKHRSFWNRGLHYVNAKYSTVFLIFIFSVYNIYPIEVLKYQKKDDLQDYQPDMGGVSSVCSMKLDEKNIGLLTVTNYGYNLMGISIPCVIILIISIIILYRIYKNNQYMNKEGIPLHCIAATIGIIHSLFNLPGRFSDILMMFLASYGSTFFPRLIHFNHEAYSFITLSYAYKCFVCIFLSRRFRLHAKSVLCFLIENKYEDRHTIEIVNTNNDWQQQLSKKKQHKRYYHQHYEKDSYLNKTSLIKPTSKNFSSLFINKDDLKRHISSETTYWIRPYFTQNEKRNLLRPCGRSSSCHQISAKLPLIISELPNKKSPVKSDPSSSHVISVNLPNGEYIHLPLPQKRAYKYRSNFASSTLTKNRIDPSLEKNSIDIEKSSSINRINFLSSSNFY